MGGSRSRTFAEYQVKAEVCSQSKNLNFECLMDGKCQINNAVYKCNLVLLS